VFLQQFPDLSWLKKSIASRFGERKDWQGRPLSHEGWPSVVLNVRASNVYRDNIAGPVSVFCNISGSSAVTVEGRRVVIPEGYFFISNEGQPYTLEVGKQQTETFNVHFGKHFVSQTLLSMTQSDFEPDNSNHQYNFRNRLLPVNESAKRIIQKIQQDHSSIHEEENLFELFGFLVGEEVGLKNQVQKIPSLKKSTQEEIVKRLLTSIDFIYSSSQQKLSLDQLAREACLSKFHFLRLFKSTFNKTPYQFMNEVRVERAKTLLRKRGLSVREIAHKTGFDSTSSFSRTFYNTAGIYPTQFQRV
jgi:AraC family transcriptional regulator